MKVLYFAWLRERIGESEEVIDAAGIATPTALAAYLKDRSEAHQLAFADLTAVRVAIDKKVSDWDAPLDGAAEVAFFPPMTGG